VSDESQDQQQTQPESELIRVRREKLARITELGWDAYPTKAHTTTTVAEVVARYSPRTAEELDAAPEHVAVAGRIMAIRDFGKASFIVLSEMSSRIQVYARRENLDIGDWISVEGPMMRTKKGELSIKAENRISRQVLPSRSPRSGTG
jgi:lysyl-tRNA synthetase, class II